MEMLVIDKSYDGLVNMGNYFCYPGDLHLTAECVKINVNLVVDGNLEVYGCLVVGGYFDVNGHLKVGGNLKVGEYFVVGGCLEVGRYLEVNGYLKVNGCLKVGEYKSVLGVKTSMCVLLHLEYYVIKLSNHLKIGCKFYPLDVWRNFTDRDILNMDGKKGLRFWKKYKEFLLTKI